VDGIVIGFLLANGNIDIKRTKQFIEAADPLSVTFHRAFDMCKEPIKALHKLKKIGISRILTSGQKNTAIEGKELIKELIKEAGNNIIIMPGAGLNESNIKEFAKETGAVEFHATLRSDVQSRMKYRKERVSMGGIPQFDEYSIKETDAEKVKRFVEQLRIMN
jgi:copper homeostasis protein